MTSDTSRGVQGCSSSDLTVTSVPSDAILKLGKRIVDELESEQRVDTLSRWMAHSIAELIHDAEASEAKDQPTRLVACSDAILDLWKHRHELPSGKRPFEDIEPIMRALESLDPDNKTPRVFCPEWTRVDEEQEVEAANWLNLADSLDDSVRILIGYCLRSAVDAAADKSKEWVALAEKAYADVRLESRVVSFIYDGNDRDSTEMNSGSCERPEDILKRLTGFNKLAEDLAADLRNQSNKSNH